MALAPINPTQLTPPRVALIDERSGAISREWYRFFLSLLTATETNQQEVGTTPDANSLMATYDAMLASLAQETQTNTSDLSASLQQQINDVFTATAITPPPSGGTVTSVDASGGSTGLLFTGGPITTSGTLTLSGTLVAVNGGTGTSTAFTAGSVVFAGASGVYSQNNTQLFWDNANNRLGVGNATPAATLDVTGNIRMSGANPNIELNSGGPQVYVPAASTLAFATGGGISTPVERFRIGPSGEWGISGATYGSAGQVFTSGGASAPPTWTTPTTGSGTVTSVSGTGTVNGITLTGTVTSSGSLTLGGALSNVSLTSQVINTLPITNGGTGTAATFTGGSIVFASSTGIYTENNTQLFWDNANNRLGVGNSTPAAAFDVTGNIRMSGANPNIELNSGGPQVYVPAASTLAFATGGGISTPVERFRIGPSGEWGIGGATYGSAGQVFTSGGSGAAPTWTTPTTGTVTSVSGTGSVNGITLTGTVTSSGSLTLGGTLSNVSLTTQVTGTLPVGNGGTGTATAFTAGSVVFAGASGTYTQNNTQLFWDNANNRLGVGNATPAATLDVTGNIRMSGANPNIELNSGGPQVYVPAASTLAFATGGGISTPVERFRIGPSGEWGIGGATYGSAGQVFTSGGASAAPTWTTPTTGTVTSVSGTGTVNGITLTGTVTSSGSLTLGGTLSNVSLTTQVTGTLPVGNGGTGATTLTGYIKGNGTSAFTASTTVPASDVTGLATVATSGSFADLSNKPGIRSNGQNVITANTTLGAADSGTNILIVTSGITITFPSTGFASGEGVVISNISGGNVTLSAPGGSDFGATLPNDGTFFAFCDGGGFWRQYCYSTTRL